MTIGQKREEHRKRYFVRFLVCNHKRITSGMGCNYKHMSDDRSPGVSVIRGPGNGQLEKLTVLCPLMVPAPVE